MGTVEEWGKVLVYGAAWATLMLLIELFVFTDLARNRKPAPLLTVLVWAVSGFFFGLINTFDFRVLRWPLVSVLILVLAALLAVGALYRKTARSAS